MQIDATQLGFTQIVCATVAALACLGSLAAEPRPFAEPPLFTDHTPIEIQLTANWGKLVRDKDSKLSKYPASLTIGANTATPQTLAVTLQPRGKSRRLSEICSFPPLSLKFANAQVANTLFESQTKLKLVTHCAKLGRNRSVFEDRLHSEYLLYRIYNLLTPNSFKVRPVNITYGYQKKKTTHTHPGFLIEHKSALAVRTGSDLVKKTKVSVNVLSGEPSSLAALFAYFAGNTDYNFTQGRRGDDCCHNAVALTKNDETIPVPYDFDVSGFVDPPLSLIHI